MFPRSWQSTQLLERKTTFGEIRETRNVLCLLYGKCICEGCKDSKRSRVKLESLPNCALGNARALHHSFQTNCLNFTRLS